MKVIDLSYKRYESLLYDGIVDDQDYSDWYQSELMDWLKVAKHQYNQNYVEIKTNKGIRKEYYNDYYYEEERI